ncbi:hypothetical protein CKA32_003987 [Geitlerinema sp. FC II]|nr:hypothetical protein CKA32_003987 [Geitlerinema sp. FC II]
MCDAGRKFSRSQVNEVPASRTFYSEQRTVKTVTSHQSPVTSEDS